MGLSKILNVEVNFNKIEQGNVSSFMEMPDEIKWKRAFIIVHNFDEDCSGWAVVSALYPVERNTDRLSQYSDPEIVIKLKDLLFPMILVKIQKFKKQNNIAINVYFLQLRKENNIREYFDVVPVRITLTKLDIFINLLIIEDKYFVKLKQFDVIPPENYVNSISSCLDKNIYHVSSQHLKKHKRKKYICDRCMNYFSTQEKLEKHTEYSKNKNNAKIAFPNYDFIEFKNYSHNNRASFIVYADIESMLKRIHIKNV